MLVALRSSEKNKMPWDQNWSSARFWIVWPEKQHPSAYLPYITISFAKYLFLSLNVGQKDLGADVLQPAFSRPREDFCPSLQLIWTNGRVGLLIFTYVVILSRQRPWNMLCRPFVHYMGKFSDHNPKSRLQIWSISWIETRLREGSWRLSIWTLKFLFGILSSETPPTQVMVVKKTLPVVASRMWKIFPPRWCSKTNEDILLQGRLSCLTFPR